MRMIRMNNKSMVGWIKQQFVPNQNELQFFVYSLEQEKQTWRTIKLCYNFKIDWTICSAEIADLYEIRPGYIYVKLVVEPDGSKIKERLLDDEAVLYQYQKEYDLILDSKTEEIRPAKFSKIQPHFIQFVNQYRPQKLEKQIKSYIEKARKARQQNMKPKNSTWYSPNTDYIAWLQAQPKQRQLPIYYIDVNSEEIVAKEIRSYDIIRKYERDPKRPQFSPVTHNSRMLVEYFEERGKCFRLHIRVRKIKQFKYCSELTAVHMINEMVADADDDLLNEVATLLVSRQKDGEWDWSQQQ